MKRAIIIYDTKFGNTEKVAKALALGMEKGGIKVDCVKVNEIDVNRLVDYDFLAFGAPTHAFGISKPMEVFLEKLKSVNLKGKKAFAFDTKFKSLLAGSAAKGIEKKLKGFGMNIVEPHTSAIVKGSKGPLTEGMEETFEKIGFEIAPLI
ncbi:MAG: flavodoxin domain-containing protein [Candidatus Bathyarchaeia archaeon]